MKDTDRERMVLIMALRYALKEQDHQGIYAVIDQIKFREHDIRGIRSDARNEVIAALGGNEHTVSTWVALWENDNDHL